MRQLAFLLIVMMSMIGNASVSAQMSSKKKILIVYFSRTGNTKALAEQINEFVSGQLFRIETVEPYPENFDEMLAKASKEKKSDAKPPLKTKVENINQYDLIFIGFPIWDMNLPSPIKSFAVEHGLKGKTIIPFCTNDGYGRGNSFDALRKLYPDSNFLEGFAIEGKKVTSSKTEVQKWLQEIKLVEQQ